MNLERKVKRTIQLSIVAVVVVVVVFVLWRLSGTKNPAREQVSLGQNYLNEANYSGAIAQFSNAILSDPYNTKAYIGLAKAYSGNQQPEKAIELLEDVESSGTMNVEMGETLIQIYEEKENITAAIQVTEKLIDSTDDEKYYQKQKELLEKYYNQKHSYAVGSNQELYIQDGVVLSKGSNIFGQLGTSTLGNTEIFASAEFPQQPKAVYCAGQTSYVVDSSGNLWSCGENRWGQMGQGYGSLSAQMGWQQLTDTGDVAAVEGSVGYLAILKKDGTLWQAGVGETQTLERELKFSSVLEISSAEGKVAALTSGGKLYVKDISNGTDWTQIKRNVTAFDFYGSTVIALERTGELIQDAYNTFYQPTSITETEESPFFVKIAANNSCCFLLDWNNVLWELSNGTLQQKISDSKVTSLYREGSFIVTETEDGDILLWDDMGKQVDTTL